MKIALITSLILTLFGSLAHAKDKYCPQTEVFNPLILAEGSRIDCNQVSPIERFGAEVLALSPLEVQIASLKITNEHLVKSENTGSGVIMPLTEKFESSQAEKAVFAHELGHTIFDAYFYQNFSKTKKLRSLNNQISIALGPLVKSLDTNGECISTRCMEIQNKLQLKRILEIKEQERDELEGELEMTLEYLTEFVKPYNELIGDAVAVLHFEDPAIMEVTLKNINPSRKSKNVECRSFLIDKESVFYESDHCAFSGLRQKIYNDILLPGIESNTKKKALEVLLKLVTSEIEKLYNIRLKESLDSVSDSDINELSNRNYVVELNSLISLLNQNPNQKKTCK